MSGLTAEQQASALNFEAEGMSGHPAFESVVGYTTQPGEGQEAGFWLVQTPSAPLAQIDEAVQAPADAWPASRIRPACRCRSAVSRRRRGSASNCGRMPWSVSAATAMAEPRCRCSTSIRRAAAGRDRSISGAPPSARRIASRCWYRPISASRRRMTECRSPNSPMRRPCAAGYRRGPCVSARRPCRFRTSNRPRGRCRQLSGKPRAFC